MDIPIRVRSLLLQLFFFFMLLKNAPLGAQESAVPDPKIVDKAVKKGADFLVLKYWRTLDKGKWTSNAELVLLALSRARVRSEQSGFFQKIMEDLDTLPLEYTYRVALLAMTLESLDPVRYRERIAHCAQWLVDTQMEDGEWSYPHASPPIHVEPPLPTKEEESLPPVARTFLIKKHSLTVTRKDKGDISNTQFALLGLRACSDAGIQIPKSTWESALSYFTHAQNQDGGWGYCIGDAKPDASYASITCAGVASLALCQSAMGRKNISDDPSIQAGLKWIGVHFSPSRNANIEKRNALRCNWLYFYLYSVERLGSLLNLKRLGDKEWYSSGVGYVLEQQRENGSWLDNSDESTCSGIVDRETVDTCFAMLFLRRGTHPLVNAEDPRHH